MSGPDEAVAGRETTTRIRVCGEVGLMLDCADLPAAVALAAELELLRPEAVDVVAGARTVLVTARDAAALPGLRRRIEALLSGRSRGAHGADPAPSPLSRVRDPDGARSPDGSVRPREVTIDVRYDGPDLADVAALAGVPAAEIVRLHTEVTWRAAFGGFAPGFFYLVDERELAGGVGSGLPSVPRLASPRPRVSAGSVGLADRFCAVYPGPSPGGWRVIGTTATTLWDPGHESPALLAPGDSVRFRERHG